MRVTAKSLGIDKLDVEQRLTLVEEIWASICTDAQGFPLSDAQRRELDRRVAEDEESPDDVVPWEDVRAALRAKAGG